MATELTGTTEPARGHAPTRTVMASMFARAGEMGARIGAHDWSDTPLGDVEAWPPSLRHALSLSLQSRDAIVVWWGPELVMLCNDACRDALGGLYGRALGCDGERGWPEIWSNVAPQLRSVLAGAGATSSDDIALIVDRDGRLEERYFTFSHSPIDCAASGSSSGVGGVFTSITETTHRVRAEQPERRAGAEPRRRADALATRLQRGLLPDVLPDSDGVTAAAAYIPRTDEDAAGGDWYELMELDEGRTLVAAVGDILGHGVAAATAMSELRHSLRLLAAEGTQPAEALGRLNEFVHTVGSGHFATCWYGWINREAMTITYASAGHLPPLLIGPNAAASVIGGGVGAPVGALRGTIYREERLALPPGAMVLLYTNGLVEHHVAPDADPIECLVRQAHGAEPRRLVADLVAQMPANGSRRDDAAVLALRVERFTPHFHRELPLLLTALRDLRNDLRGWLAEQSIDPQVAAEVVLGVCEIVTNAVEHAIEPRRPSVTVEARVRGDVLTIEVRDSGRWRIRRHQPERGRGIAIARKLLDIDIERGSAGTTVRLRRVIESTTLDAGIERSDESGGTGPTRLTTTA